MSATLNQLSEKPAESLELEIKKFADGLPYWGKYIARKILSGASISDTDIDQAYSYLLEDLKLLPDSKAPSLTITYNKGDTNNYKKDLVFKKLESIQGVNALAENQILEVCTNATIIYGSNGSGKSGYGRLLKKVFYSKSPEEIIRNIHLEKGHKTISASFTFSSGGKDISLNYPADSGKPEFEQFSVFDGKGVLNHIDARNEFEFRPAGLTFFSVFTESLKIIEGKLVAAISSKQSENNFPDLFEGESEIKTLIDNLSADTKISDLKKYLPFSEQDKTEKNRIEKEYDELILASKGKEKEIRNLESIKQMIATCKANIEKLNRYFSAEALSKVDEIIKGFIEKEQSAKEQGIQGFQSDLFMHIGSKEWKEFIVAAEAFAQKQRKNGNEYPQDGDNCLLCHQPLAEPAQQLISKYWQFIRSEAEKRAADSLSKLQTTKTSFEKLDFGLLPDGNILTTWLSEKKPIELEKLQKSITGQKKLAELIVLDLDDRRTTKKDAHQIASSELDEILKSIDESIRILREDAHADRLKELLKEKNKLAHKEKLEQRFDKIEEYINSQIWIRKAGKVNWGKRAITDEEKSLSSKYFNQKYIDTFNKECSKLDGSFGISINHTGSAGTSYRQLTLKGNMPSSILSEGEQKVIALADFLSEMQLSEINRGIIFDDPVNSLDEKRKKQIAERIAEESKNRQVMVFTHDLIFVSLLLLYCEDHKIPSVCHWIEKRENVPGQIWLNNSPSYEKEYRNAVIPQKHYSDAKRDNCPPSQREFLVKTGFTALRTCYEVLVINDLFKNVVQRYNERVSVDSLSSVSFDALLISDLLESFAQCCRYMEGHTHSDKYAYQKPELINLNEEIQRYESIKSKIKKFKKN